jgi:hypothetical protein
MTVPDEPAQALAVPAQQSRPGTELQQRYPSSTASTRSEI